MPRFHMQYRCGLIFGVTVSLPHLVTKWLTGIRTSLLAVAAVRVRVLGFDWLTERFPKKPKSAKMESNG